MTSNSILSSITRSIQSLSIDAIEAANSGHPGLPLGCAQLVASLFSDHLRFNPQNPNWPNRDRFILSAGHGSMLLYSILHLAGYEVSLDAIQQFRQLGSPTAGHPEYGELPGIETTTGPLGQGVANTVGMALAHRMVAHQLGLPDTLYDAQFYCLAGDGCLMEGVSAEAASLAGHLALGNITLIYDSNDICLDGPTSECFTEDTQKRFEAYGWHVITVDGHNFSAIDSGFKKAKKQTNKPTLIIAKTEIGKGSPHRAGTSEAHGKPLGTEEAQLTKKTLGIPIDQPFFVDPKARTHLSEVAKKNQKTEKAWAKEWETWMKKNPKAAEKWASLSRPDLNQVTEAIKQAIIGTDKATRASSKGVLQILYQKLPALIGGSADLSCSDSTMMGSGQFIKPKDYSARNIKYGVREFAMGSIATGISLHGTFIPYCGTFLTFSDYMRNAIRMAALMKQQVIYQFTHDSVHLGEDGPTHQPVEHLASLRAIPGLTVIRPADANEVKGAWITALNHKNGPTALILSRQSMPDIQATAPDKVKRGGYVVFESGDHPDVCLIGTGSEVHLCLVVAHRLAKKGRHARVVSLPSWELFSQQPSDYQKTVIPANIRLKVSVEAGTQMGWHQYVGDAGLIISIDQFGMSGPGPRVAAKFGFSPESIVKKVLKRLDET